MLKFQPTGTFIQGFFLGRGCMQEILFTYGSLQWREVQLRIIGREVPMTADVLGGYRAEPRTFSDGTYPILLREEGGRIEGKIMHITPPELARIDQYETDAYDRIRVTLESGLEAWVYVAPE
jgi:gamma-glutamylcyclotransferase (GGCT)/AIG2-like uncharacterized protein YtfP